MQTRSDRVSHRFESYVFGVETQAERHIIRYENCECICKWLEFKAKENAFFVCQATKVPFGLLCVASVAEFSFLSCQQMRA